MEDRPLSPIDRWIRSIPRKTLGVMLLLGCCILTATFLGSQRKSNLEQQSTSGTAQSEGDEQRFIDGKWRVKEPRKKAENTKPDPLVYIVGEVVKPGLHRFPAGTRLKEALDTIGGCTPEADLTRVNLAAVLRDGQKITVFRRSKTKEETKALRLKTKAKGKGQASSKNREAKLQPIDINLGTLKELSKLPGSSAELAREIIRFRSSVGQFSSVDSLLGVKGMTATTLRKMKPWLRISFR